jgi:NAD(P)-dependent dehydrogenase (short-subunit alcohol dehydrogenase family)
VFGFTGTGLDNPSERRNARQTLGDVESRQPRFCLERRPVMDAKLGGKRALITGGASGIAQAIAFALGDEGVDVAVADRSPATETILGLQERGVRAVELGVDVSDEAQVVYMVAEATNQLGGLDLYINAAATTHHEPVTRITTEAWQETLNTNLNACVWACREIAQQFIAQGSGTILIVGSTVMYTPAYEHAAYRVSKSSLKILMETLSIELAPHGIRVNMLTPGAYPTRLVADVPEQYRRAVELEIPLRREGHVEELCATAVLLLSDALSSYTTGADYMVDGGLHLRPIAIVSDEEIHAMNIPPEH